MSQDAHEAFTVLSRNTNSWVVRLPNRQHPAVVIQGDSLKILYDLAEEVMEGAGGNVDLKDIAEELRDQLRGHLTLYEQALDLHGLGLPYSGRIT